MEEVIGEPLDDVCWYICISNILM